MKRTDKIKAYYDSNMGKDLPEYALLGWESEEAQRSRFDALIASVDLQGKRLLDVGCGTGNLLEYIISKGINAEYTGIDLLPDMIECARSKKLGGKFNCIDIFRNNPFKPDSFDVIYSSGIFNLNLGNNVQFLSEALELFFKLSTEFVVFNLLHHKSPGREDQYFYFVPEDVKKLIEDLPYNFKDIKIIEKYLQNDFTVVCRK